MKALDEVTDEACSNITQAAIRDNAWLDVRIATIDATTYDTWSYVWVDTGAGVVNATMAVIWNIVDKAIDNAERVGS